MLSNVKEVEVRRSFHLPFPRHNRTTFIGIDTGLCTSCGSCVAECPRQVLGLTDFLGHCHVHVDRAPKCRGCHKCVQTCQHGAIQPRMDAASRRFSNPAGSVKRSFGMLLRLLSSKRAPWPAHVAVEPRRPPSPQHPDEAIVTFIGHSTFLIQTSLGNILTDPIYSERAGPLQFLGPRRVRQPGVAFDDLPEISLVLISHNHYDHLDLPTLRALDRRFHPLFVTPLKNGPLLKSAGILRVQQLNWWEHAATVTPRISLTPAQHFSARTLFDRNRALWGGFVISTGPLRIFFAGDTGYGRHFRDIHKRYGPVDLALLPIGAYEPRWFMKDIHMNPAEAVQAHLDLEARQSIGMHFGTFRLAQEGIADPVADLEREPLARQLLGKSFRTLDVGGSLRLGGPRLDNRRTAAVA